MWTSKMAYRSGLPTTLNKENMYTHEGEDWIAEYCEGGFIFLANKATGEDGIVKLVNERGQSISLGQFNSGCKSHSFDKACEVFWRLRG